MTEAEAGLVVNKEIPDYINQGRLHSLSMRQLRDLLARFEQAGAVLFGTNPDPQWFEERRQTLLDAIEKKRVEAAHQRLAIAGIVVAALVALVIAYWQIRASKPNANTPQPTLPQAQPTPLATTPPPKASPTPSATREPQNSPPQSPRPTSTP